MSHATFGRIPDLSEPHLSQMVSEFAELLKDAVQADADGIHLTSSRDVPLEEEPRSVLSMIWNIDPEDAPHRSEL